MHQCKRLSFLLKFGILVAFFLFSAAFPADKGKIAGRVTNASTGEPLPGANVVIEGTQMGASADLDGFYFIINVSPGSYTVKAMMMGNATLIKKNVQVNINQTTTLNFELPPETIKGEEIVVTAEQPVVRLDISASQKVLNIDAIQSRPVENFEELLSTEVGIRMTASNDGSGLIVRAAPSTKRILLLTDCQPGTNVTSSP